MVKEMEESVVFLKKALGVQLLEIVLKTDSKTINKWLKGELQPSERQEITVRSARNVVEILLDYLSSIEAKWWLVNHSDYLYGIPAVEISRRPEDVRYAALNRVTKGDMYG